MNSKASYIAAQLARHIASGQWPPGTPIPSRRNLAHLLSVSRDTIDKAVGELVSAGTLERRAGHSGLFVPGVQQKPLPGVPRCLRERVAQQIEEQIWSGKWERDSVLSIKQLCGRFRCSYRPMRSALDLLTERRLVERVGRSYAVLVPSRRADGPPHLYFLASPRVLSAFQGGADAVLHSLERALLGGGGAKLVCVFAVTPHEVRRDFLNKTGAFVRFMFQPPSGLLRIERQAPSVPRIYLDPTENYRVSPKWKRTNSVVVYFDNYRAGELVARHLLDTGHRRAALLTHIASSTTWCGNRIRGVESAFAHPAGGALELVRFGPPNPVHPGRHATTLERIGESMDQVFTDAIRKTAITAWICINDELAAAATGFLKTCGAAGRSVAVAGFDNSPLSRLHQFTSCDMGFDRMGRAVADLVTAPQLVGRDSDGHVPVAPRVIPRG